ncbi:MAG TPA: hypothetical protein PKD55_22020, partial [Bellilinea sp.]|nr:hypothetical protein [Bellilinea sp.]
MANFPPVISDTVPPMMAEVAVPATMLLLTYGAAPAVTPALTKPCPNLPPWITLATPPLVAAISTRLVVPSPLPRYFTTVATAALNAADTPLRRASEELAP